MFTQARLKLTAWYVLIIMFVSFSFSAFIYQSVSNEFQRRLNLIENRLQLPARGFPLPPGQAEYFIQDIEEVKEGVFLLLLYTNVVIFFFSAASGYFLAGKTLQPIEKTLEEQKRFVADASHELKTPLTALQTSIEVAIRDKKLTLRDAKSTLSDSLGDVQNMSRLANDLLSLTKYQTANNNFSLEVVDFKEVISTVVKTLKPIASKKNISIIVKVGKAKIKANKASMEKLITILLDNAVKYTKTNGKVIIDAKLKRRRLELKVSDSGVGISKKDMPYIFDRFYQVSSSRSKNEVPGFGLGLSMAKKIVEIHKGWIKVDSKPGKGTTFTVSLPVKR